jgi:ElaB/YqjD/DUF883 family membrane-anchored ribosome-binding protein
MQPLRIHPRRFRDDCFETNRLESGWFRVNSSRFMEVTMPPAHKKHAPTDDGPENGGSASAGGSDVSGLAGEAMDRIEDVATSMADRGEEMLADVGETLRSAGRATTDFASGVAERARTAGVRAARSIEAELVERPWTVALAAAAVAGVLGFLIGSRRHGRY